jgi:hypothetical protein
MQRRCRAHQHGIERRMAYMFEIGCRGAGAVAGGIERVGQVPPDLRLRRIGGDSAAQPNKASTDRFRLPSRNAHAMPFA